MGGITARVKVAPRSIPLLCLLAVILAALSFHRLLVPSVEDLRDDGPTVNIWQGLNAVQRPTDVKTRIYNISGNIEYAPHQSGLFHLTADDCVRELKINGKAVPLEGISPLDRCNIRYGFYLSLGQYLESGSNPFTVVVEDGGGAMAFSIAGSLFGPAIGKALFVLFYLAALASLCLALRLDRLTTALILAAASAFLGFVYGYSYIEYTHDVVNHYQYISYILQNAEVPRTYEGWEFYQPAFFYLLAALLIKVLDFFHFGDTVLSLRLFTCVLFTGFLLFSALAMRKILGRGLAYYALLGCLAFMPAGTTMAGHVNNDLLLYFLYSATFYFLVCWWQDRTPDSLGKTVMCAGLAAAAKSSGLILGVVIGLAVLYRLSRREMAWRDLTQRTLMVCVLAAAVVCSTNFVRSTYDRLSVQGAHLNLLGPVDFMPDYIKLDKSAYYLVSFDYSAYMQAPFFNPGSDATGRQYFWNTLLKSSLFGENGWHGAPLALLLSFIQLLMVAYCVISAFAIVFLNRQAAPSLAFCFMALLPPVLVLLATRALYPISPLGDFRYIYPAAVPFLIAYGLVIAWYRERELSKMATAGLGLAVAFGPLCLAFILYQHYMR